MLAHLEADNSPAVSHKWLTVSETLGHTVKVVTALAVSKTH